MPSSTTPPGPAISIAYSAPVLGGRLLYLLVERPFLRLRDRFLEKTRRNEKKVPAPL